MSSYRGQQNNNCRGDLRRQAHEQRRRVGTLGMLQLGEQSWSEREAELVDCDHKADNPREMLPWKFLLNDEARKRRRIADARSEQQTTQVEHRSFGGRRQDSNSERLHDEVDRGYGAPVETVDDKSGRDAPDHGSEGCQADSPTSQRPGSRSSATEMRPDGSGTRPAQSGRGQTASR